MEKIPNWTLNSWLLGCTYAAYKNKGFIYAIKTFFNTSFIEIVRWLFNHCKRFKRYLLNKAAKRMPGLDLLLELCLTDKFVDWEDLYKRHPEIKRQEE